jgi:CubicO group peptidase (beta-lactamase class C family)
MDLQGAIIERLTGETLPDYMRRHIFEPLGMADTGFFVPPDKLARLASLYHRYGVPTLSVLDTPAWVRDPRRVPGVPSGGGGLYATLGDYGRFAQMLLNRGALGGARIVSAEAAALMMTNHLPAAIIERGVDAGFQQIGPGRGYGYNGAVFFDPDAAGSPVGRGTYQWDGASGVWFWVDPEHQITFVGMIQRMLQVGMPPLQALTQAMIARALEPPRGS